MSRPTKEFKVYSVSELMLVKDKKMWQDVSHTFCHHLFESLLPCMFQQSQRQVFYDIHSELKWVQS